MLLTLAAQQARGFFTRWATTTFPALQDLKAWMLHQWEQIAEAGVSDTQPRAFAAACSLGSMECAQIVAALGAYHGRKGFGTNWLAGTFIDSPLDQVDVPQGSTV